MIEYRKNLCGLPLLFHGFYGSAFSRALPFPILSTVFAAILFYVRPESLPVASGRPGIDNEEGYQKAAFRAPYPFQVNSPCHVLSKQGLIIVSCAPLFPCNPIPVLPGMCTRLQRLDLPFDQTQADLSSQGQALVLYMVPFPCDGFFSLGLSRPLSL